WSSDGITPVLVSLVSAEAWPGRARLVWYVEDSGLRVTVYRTGGEGWIAVGTAFADGSGRITYEDDRVAPGGRYGYRGRGAAGGAAVWGAAGGAPRGWPGRGGGRAGAGGCGRGARCPRPRGGAPSGCVPRSRPFRPPR